MNINLISWLYAIAKRNDCVGSNLEQRVLEMDKFIKECIKEAPKGMIYTLNMIKQRYHSTNDLEMAMFILSWYESDQSPIGE